MEIITPALTFSTTLAPIIQLGYVPKFIDSELTTYVPSVQSICDAITNKTRAIMIPNLIGNKPDFDTLRNELMRMGMEHIPIIEDSADTITYTECSDVSTTSFYVLHY